MSRYRLTKDQVALIKELKKQRRRASDRLIDVGVKRYFSWKNAKEMIDKFLATVKANIDRSKNIKKDDQ